MDCIFCKIANGEIASNIVYESELVVAIMDASPVVDGHVLIIPKKHFEDYTELDEETTLEVFKVAKMLGPKIMEGLDKDALTLLINYGSDQKVKHFHLHLLPEFGSDAPSRAVLSITDVCSKIKNTIN